MQTTELLREMWRTQRAWTLFLGILLVCNLVFFLAMQFVLSPRIDDREQRFLTMQAETRQILQGSGNLAGGGREQVFVRAGQDLTAFHQLIPEHRDLTGLIEELLVLAYRAGLDITQISYGTEKRQPVGLIQYDLSFGLTGRYEQLKRFIHALEQSPRIMSIQQMAMGSINKNGLPQATLQLKLESFFRNETVGT